MPTAGKVSSGTEIGFAPQGERFPLRIEGYFFPTAFQPVFRPPRQPATPTQSVCAGFRLKWRLESPITGHTGRKSVICAGFRLKWQEMGGARRLAVGVSRATAFDGSRPLHPGRR